MSTATLATEIGTKTVSEEKKATREVKAKIDRLRELRAIKSAAEKEAKTLSAEIAAYAGPGVKRLTWGKTKLASLLYKTHRHASLEILAEAFPEAYTASLVETPYVEVR